MTNNNEEQKSKKDLKINATIVVAIIASFANLLSAYLNIDSQNQIESLKRAFEQQVYNLEVRKFEADKTISRNQILSEWIPKIVSDNEADQNAGIAVLISILPDEAEEILTNVRASMPENDSVTVTVFSDAIEAAGTITLSVNQGTWIVVTATLSSLQEARDWIDMHGPQEFSWKIYSFKEGFAPSAGPYPTKEAAEFAAIGIRFRISPTAYLLDLDATCTKMEKSKLKEYEICK